MTKEVAAAVVTGLLSFVGGYLLAERQATLTLRGDINRAKLELKGEIEKVGLGLTKERRSRQLDALEKLQRDLKTLEGELLLMKRRSAQGAAKRDLADEAALVGGTMGQIYAETGLLDQTCTARGAVQRLLTELGPKVAAAQNDPGPENISALVRYFDDSVQSEEESIQRLSNDEIKKLLSSPSDLASPDT